MEELRERAICLWQDEHYLLASWNKPSSSLGAGSASGGESSAHQTEQEKLAEVSGHPLSVNISFDLINIALKYHKFLHIHVHVPSLII